MVSAPRSLAAMMVALGCLLAFAAVATAQRVEAHLEPARVTIDGTTDLVVEVSAGNLRVDVSEPDLPSLPGLEVVATSRSSEVRMIGTDITRRMVFRYTLRPRTAGTLRIDPVHVRVDGVDHATRPVRLFVVDSADLGPPPEVEAGAPPAVFAVTRVDRRSAWTGEQVTLTFAFYHDPRVPLGESPDYDPPETPGFWRVELDDQPAVTVERVGGRTYHVQRFHYALFPLRDGELTIGPATVRIVEPDPARWWTSGERPRTIRTESLRVIARPLPEGAPPGYDGAVGRLRLHGTLERRSAPAGTPLELELVVEGTGNPTAVPPPDLPQWPDVTVGSPSVEATTTVRGGTVAGRTTFRFLLTPRQPGALDLGDARLAFFDPSSGSYAVDTLRLGEIEVEPGTAVASANARNEGPTLWDARAPSAPGPRGWAGEPWYWIALAGPWTAWILVLGATRLRGISPFATASGDDASVGLGEVARALADGRPDAAEDAARAVRRLVRRRWDVDLAIGDPAALRAELEAEGVDPALADAVAEARRATAATAYGGGSPSAAVAAIERVESLLGPDGADRAGGRAPSAGPGASAVLLLAFAITASGALAQSASLEERWEAANRAYREGDFRTAATVYGELASTRLDPRLEANRAAALWRAGEEGSAVAAYLRSLELDPRASRVRADLADLRAGLGDPPFVDAAPPAPFDYVRLDEWLAALLAISWAAFLTILLASRWPGVRPAVPVLATLFVLVAALAAVDAATVPPDRAVARSDTPIQSRPEGRTIATLPEGAVAAVLERGSEAWRIRVPGLPAGWVASDRIVPLH